MPTRLTNAEYDIKLAEINNSIIRVGDYINRTTKIQHKCLKCNHTWDVAPSDTLGKHTGCPVCRRGARIVKIGVNDLYTTAPEIIELLSNPDDGYKYSKNSGFKIDWKCPICGKILNRKIYDVTHFGLKCPNCSRSISYPNRLMSNILEQINNQYDVLKQEYSDSWCKYYLDNKWHKCYYDFYFKKDGRNILIEMDGGFHFENIYLTESEFKQSQQVDIIKNNLALTNNFDIIRIDCNYGKNTCNRLAYIKNNILESKLSEILDLTQVDFEVANEKSIVSDTYNIIKLYNLGHRISDISKELEIGRNFVLSCIKRATENGLCNYDFIKDNREVFMNNLHINTRKVVLLNTREIFDSQNDAKKKYSLKANINRCCQLKSSYAGVYNGEKLVWVYYEDYLNMTDDDIKHRLESCVELKRKVIRIENFEIFNSLSEAVNNILSDHPKAIDSAISRACKNKTRAYGFHWMYYDEYEQMTESEKHSLLLCS